MVAAVFVAALAGMAALIGSTTPSACAGSLLRGVEPRFLLMWPGERDDVLLAWQQALDRAGIPYVVRIGQRSPGRLIGGDGAGRYAAVVIGPEAERPLTGAARRALSAYERSYGVREVAALAVPVVRSGDPGVPAFVRVPGPARVAGGRAPFPHLRGPVPLEQPLALVARGAGGRPADVLARAADGTPLVTAAPLGDGRERLAVSIYTGAELLHTKLLLPGAITWATRGMHTGLWRSYVSVHFDDVLLPNARWDVTADATTREDPIRMEASDADRAAAWSQRVGLRLDMAYNGYGAAVTRGGAGCDALLGALKRHAGVFGWLNHTWSHPDMDELGATVISEEVRRNEAFAREHDLPIDTRELATGEHSGLRNPAMPPALGATDVGWIASDASRGVGQRPLGPALTVPRYAPNIYYDVATREEQVDQYNYRYFETCRQFCLEAPVDWEGYLAIVGGDVFELGAQNDPRPAYLHQSNLAEDANALTVYEYAMGRLRATLRAEPLQPTQAQAGEVLRDLDLWRKAYRDGHVDVLVAPGEMRITARRDVRVPVTGTTFGEVYAGERSGWLPLAAGQSVVLAAASRGG